MKRPYPTYYVARRLLKPMELDNQDDYLKHYEALCLPKEPDIIYHDRWQGWDKFLSSLRCHAGYNEKHDPDVVFVNYWLTRPWSFKNGKNQKVQT
jgi:hypothetical protein